jgi:hypothetical protein
MSINTKRQLYLDKKYDELVKYIAPGNLEVVREIISEIVEMEIELEQDSNQ